MSQIEMHPVLAILATGLIVGFFWCRTLIKYGSSKRERNNMCWCTPSSRTPFCGKPDCHPPSVSDRAFVMINLSETKPLIDCLQRAMRQCKNHGLYGVEGDILTTLVEFQKKYGEV